MRVAVLTRQSRQAPALNTVMKLARFHREPLPDQDGKLHKGPAFRVMPTRLKPGGHEHLYGGSYYNLP
jgi:hypothetical protein